MRNSLKSEETGADFEADTRQSLGVLKSALTELLSSLPGATTRGNEVAKSLGIERTLAWKICKIVQEADPLAAIPFIPGRSGIAILLKAAKRRGVPERTLRAVRDALHGIDDLIATHAGDRASLEIMASACSRGQSAHIELGHRRAAFQANSFIWGAQARTQFKAVLVRPADDPQRLDFAALRGLIDLRRLRSDVPWPVARSRVADDADGIARRPYPGEPLEDGPTEGTVVPFLRRFCSHPLPELRRVCRAHGFVDDELPPGPVGNTGAVTCVIGDVCRAAASRYRDSHNRIGALIQPVHTPCEVLLLDQIIQEDTFGRITPEMVVHSLLTTDAQAITSPHDLPRLPVSGVVQYLGKGLAAMTTRDVPRYVEMAQYVFDRLGWEASRFDVYRLRIEYPPIPTLVVMRHPLPDPPAGAPLSGSEA